MDKNIITDKLLENKYQISCFGKGYYEGCYIGGYRYLLEITINTSLNNKKTLACIMMNPSTTFPNEKWESKNWKKDLNFLRNNKTKGFDPTVRNVIRMAYSKGYSKIYIFNLFPYIQPRGNDAIKIFNDKQKENEKIILNWKDNNCKELLVAWGSNLPTKDDKKNYIDLQKKYIKIFKQKNIKPVYYEWNREKNCPYHPSMQVNNFWTKINDKIVSKKGFPGKPGIVQQFIDAKTGFKKFPENYFMT